MVSIFNAAKPATIESELSRLRAENQSLSEELSQCQADKEFVWSLWKRLQVASPDITQAIGMVVQREKEKTELKDCKVLEILQLKDNKLNELQKLLESHSREISNHRTIKQELQNDVNQLKFENEQLITKCDALQTQLEDKSSREREMIGRQAVRDLDKQLMEVKQQLSKRDREISDLTQDRDDLDTIRQSQRDRIDALENDLRSVGVKYEELVSQHKDAKQLLKKYENELGTVQSELRYKTDELDKVRLELGDLWQTHNQMTDHSTQQTDIIRQLRSLQQDSQQMMKNQENAFGMETSSLQAMYQALRSEEVNLHQTLQIQKQQLLEQEDIIRDLERQLAEFGVKTSSSTAIQTSLCQLNQDSEESCSDTEIGRRLSGLQSETHLSRMSRQPIPKHASRDGTAKQLRDLYKISPYRSRSLTKGQRSRSGAHTRSKSEPRPQVQSSKSPVHTERETDVRILQRSVGSLQKKLTAAKALVEVKNVEIEEVRMAHNRRLERLRSLQSNYRLLKKQLRLAEEEQGSRRKRRRIPRADPKSLQREDSDSVWNELAFFKNENRNLMVERMNLQEEADLLKVQTAQDSATIYELRSCLEQEREELEYLTHEQYERSPSPSPDTQEQANKQVSRLEKQLKTLQKDNQALIGDRDRFLTERRDLKNQINSLHEKDADYRIKIADLNKQLTRMRREWRKKKQKPKGKTHLAKQYQRSLNSSISRMRQVFEHFGKDGWEEVSETEEPTYTSQDVETTGSLGQDIADHADMTLRSDIFHTQPALTSTPSGQGRSRARVKPSDRQKAAVDKHVNRLNKVNESPTREPTAAREPSPVHRRDAASSPIHFLRARSPVRPIVTRQTSSVGTSPPRSVRVTSVATSPHVVSRKGGIGATVSNTRQLANMKQRIQTLQHQVSLLRTSRDHVTQKNQEQKSLIEQLESDMSSTNQKLQSSRHTVQRLNADLERVRYDKEQLEQQAHEYSYDSSSTQHSEQEWAMLQSRLKTSANEVSRQLNQIKSLKAESAEQKERLVQLQDRVNHLDRDVAQKRTLLEDMKIKLRFAQENAQTDAQVMTDVENKLRNLSDANSRNKTQVESLKNRLSAVTKEKYQSEEKVIKLSEEIDRKTKQVSDLQRKNSELQSTVVAIERTAQQQLHALANQSEEAIDNAQTMLSQANNRLHEHDKFVKVLAHALTNSLQQSRLLLQQHRERKQAPLLPPTGPDPSLRRAQTLACDILNLSQSDLDDIMSVTSGDSKQVESGEQTDESKKDKRWTKKMEKTLQNKTEFALPLTELFMEKVEERNKLAAKLQSL